MRDFHGRVAVVTGAAMGMGRGLAMRLHREGCELALCDVDVETLATVKSELDSIGKAQKVSIHSVDVSDRQQMRDFANAVVTEHGDKVNLLFNNAGIVCPEAWDLMSEDTFDKVMAVNLDGVVTMTRVFWPMLLKADEAVVVNTSSVAGFFVPAAAGCAPYAVSKYAVRGFSEYLAWECKVIAPHIRVCVVHPGMINTEIQKSAGVGSKDPRILQKFAGSLLPWERRQFESLPLEQKTAFMRQKAQDTFQRLGYPAMEIADMIVDGVQAGKLRILVGWDAVIMDWWVRMFPTLSMTETGAKIVVLTSIVGRHVYGPMAAVAVVSLLLRQASKSRSRL